MNKISFLSTLVVPDVSRPFRVDCRPLTKEEFVSALQTVTHNYCGHPGTLEIVSQFVEDFPKTEKNWDGGGDAIFARPKGGVRGGQDVKVTIDDLEFCHYTIVYPEFYWKIYVDGEFISFADGMTGVMGDGNRYYTERGDVVHDNGESIPVGGRGINANLVLKFF